MQLARRWTDAALALECAGALAHTGCGGDTSGAGVDAAESSDANDGKVCGQSEGHVLRRHSTPGYRLVLRQCRESDSTRGKPDPKRLGSLRHAGQRAGVDPRLVRPAHGGRRRSCGVGHRHWPGVARWVLGWGCAGGTSRQPTRIHAGHAQHQQGLSACADHCFVGVGGAGTAGFTSLLVLAGRSPTRIP